MSKKGNETKKWILTCAESLFSDKGFCAVTMKDICEITGLSRGGLYRHYDSTDTIFESLLKEKITESDNDITKGIESKEPAIHILNQNFDRLETEMNEREHSLSFAIYEYTEKHPDSFIQRESQNSRDKWNQLLQYGIESGEFMIENPLAVVDLLLYLYQGVRMWSRIDSISKERIQGMMAVIKTLIIKQERKR